MRLRPLLAASLLGLSVFALTPEGGLDLEVRSANATIALLMTTEELVTVSKHVVVATPVERVSKWEKVAGSNRIVTYTRLEVEDSIVGKSEASVWVRTLGGKVDKLGQSVAGEAEFKLGEPAVVFLAPVEETLVVVGMAQGHFPVAEVEGERVLQSSPDVGTLVRKKGDKRRSAREDLLGAKLAAAKTKILEVAKAAGK